MSRMEAEADALGTDIAGFIAAAPLGPGGPGNGRNVRMCRSGGNVSILINGKTFVLTFNCQSRVWLSLSSHSATRWGLRPSPRGT